MARPNSEEAAWTRVPLYAYLNPGLLKRLDRAAEATGRHRGSIVRSALKRYLKGLEKSVKPN